MSSLRGMPSSAAGISREGPGSGAAVAASYAGTRLRTVLVVEDDLFSAFALRSLLERGRLAVVETHNGMQALETLDSGARIEVVFMDITMPVMDGYETMTAIRQRPRLLNLPIVALTAKDVQGERERCLAAGASDLLSKPIDIPTLWAALDVWMPPACRATQSRQHSVLSDAGSGPRRQAPPKRGG